MGAFSYRILGTICPRWLRELFLPASGAVPADPAGEGAGADTDGNTAPAVSPVAADGPTGEGAGADADGDTTPAVTPGVLDYGEADLSDLDLGAYCGVRPHGYRRTYNTEGAIEP